MSDIRRLHERIADLEVQLSTKMDEIAQLTDYNARLHADIAEIGKDNDELEAEIARLRAVAQEDPEREAHDRLGEFFLKPDTGEKS